jgi:hypothetical protein
VEIFAGAAAGAVARGLLLGFLAGSLDRDAERTASPGAAAPAAGGRAGGEGVSPPAGASSSSPWPLASLADDDASRRALVRLFLDVLERPPTRDELAAALPLSHADRWVMMQTLMGRAGKALETEPEALARRFLGRVASPAEHEALLALSRGDAEQYAFLLAASEQYARPVHRRERSPAQLAGSLLTDLLGRPAPTGAREKLAGDARLRGTGRAAVAREILSGAGRSPGEQPTAEQVGEPPEAWVRDAYWRLLLRAPAPAEVERALGALRAPRADGWQAVLLSLIESAEYLAY